MSVYVCWEASAPKSHKSVSLRQRQISNKVNFLLICVSEKCHFCFRMFGKYMSLKNGSNLYLGDDRVKELVIICNHVHFPHKNKGTASSFLKGRGRGDVVHVFCWSTGDNYFGWLPPMLEKTVCLLPHLPEKDFCRSKHRLVQIKISPC